MPTCSRKDGLVKLFPIEPKVELVWRSANTEKGEYDWMVDDSVKGFEYKMGRVIKVFEDGDGVVRSVRVNKAHGKFNRPVVKSAPVF